jgi:hypothetical protein
LMTVQKRNERDCVPGRGVLVKLLNRLDF